MSTETPSTAGAAGTTTGGPGTSNPGDGRYDVETVHPAVSGFVPPRNHAAPENTGGDVVTDPVPSLVETATPRIAKGVADLDAERIDPDGAERARNAKERALAGHQAPDTVDLPEARIRREDNAAALGGTPA